MKILMHVCRFDQGVALRNLGVVQENSTYYLYNTGSEVIITHTFVQPYESSEHSPWVAVFTVAELGELLPNNTTVRKTAEGWIAEFTTKDKTYASSKKLVEAEARADLLITLIKEKVHPVQSVNEKLKGTGQPAL